MTPNEILIDSGWKFVMSVSGGGQEIIGDLTRHGGMSSTLLEAIVPYAVPAYENLIGGSVDQIVSKQAARAAAMACYRRAMKYAPDHKVFGLASTGSVVKASGEREGRKHRVFIAIQDYERTIDISIVLNVNRSREEEETVVANCIRQALHFGCHRAGDINRQLEVGDEFTLDSAIALPNTRAIIHGAISKTSDVKSQAIFSSSCNPMHTAHLAMVEDASRRLGCRVDIELCVFNADKPPLDYLTIRERLEATRDFTAGNPHIGEVILTNKPLFFDKIDVFPGATFVVGADTFDRILDVRYYKGGYRDLEIGIDKMISWGSKFLVYPRKGYKMKSDIEILPSRCSEITTFVNPYEGYESSSLSSTEIRRRMIDAIS